jgi:hypothetical protein
MTTFAYAARPARLRMRRTPAVQPIAAIVSEYTYIPAGTADLWRNARRTFSR